MFTKMFNNITVYKASEYFNVCYSLMMVQWDRNASEHKQGFYVIHRVNKDYYISSYLNWNHDTVCLKGCWNDQNHNDNTTGKSKAVPLHAMEALGDRGGIALTHFRPRHYMGVSSQRHAPAALYPRGKDSRYPLDRRLGGTQSRSGHRGYRKNPLPPPGIEPRRPGRPARSQTLYCLS
jgi:hypothetical protein